MTSVRSSLIRLNRTLSFLVKDDNAGKVHQKIPILPKLHVEGLTKRLQTHHGVEICQVGNAGTSFSNILLQLVSDLDNLFGGKKYLNFCLQRKLSIFVVFPKSFKRRRLDKKIFNKFLLLCCLCFLSLNPRSLAVIVYSVVQALC